MDGTALDDDVGHHELSLHARHVVCGLHRHLVLLLGLLGSQRDEVHLGIAPCLVSALQTGTHIVIGDSTPEVRTQCATLAQQIVAQHSVLLQQTRLAVELHGEVSVGDGNLVGTLLVGDLDLRLRSLHGLLLEVAAAMTILLHGQLGKGHTLVFFHEGFGLLQEVAGQEQHLGLFVNAVECEWNLEGLRLLRSHVEVLNLALLHLLAVGHELPYELVALKRAEEVLVEDLDGLRLGELALSLCPDALVLIGHLVGVRVQLAVGTDDAVAVEVVVRGVVAVVVAAVGIVDLVQVGILLVADAVQLGQRGVEHLGIGLAVQGLVDEVPDVATLILRILAHQFPVLLQSARGVTHRVVVLALDERLLEVVVLAVGLARPRRVVHRAEDVGVAAFAVSLLPLAGTALVLGLHPVVGGFEVRTVHGLVAQRPYDDGGVVEVRAHVVLVALHDLLCEQRLLGLGLRTVAEAVALLVGLGGHVDAVLVAQVVPHGIVGIVAGTYGVDVQALHDLDVLNHALAAHHVATVGIQLVAVGTLEEYGLAVHQQLGILDLHAAEAHLLRDDLHGLLLDDGRS